MSTQSSTHVRQAVATAEPVDVEPVTIDADALPSTAPGDLRDLRAALAEEGYVPAGLRVEAEFGADCSIETQREADRLRSLLRAASQLGAGELVVESGSVVDPAKVRPALEALAERADREGVSLTVEGDVAGGRAGDDA